MSQQIWYILIGGQEEGPFSKSELKEDKRITPMTPARKEGSLSWLPISEYDELKDLFEENKQEGETEDKAGSGAQDQALAMRLETEPPFLFFIVLLIISLLYFFFLFQRP